MPQITYGGFKIKSVADGTLYRAQVKRSDGNQFQADGTITKLWESSQAMDADSAIGQAIYVIDTGRIK
jgi:hypothetical protein